MTKNSMTVTRASERELVVTRSINGPLRRVFAAWTDAAVFQRWWVPKSAGLTLLSCALDVRVGGTYQLVFSHPAAVDPMAFHGRYLEVVPAQRLVWTNEEAGEAGQVTTVLFAEIDGGTQLTIHDLYPTKAALDAELEAESISWNDETFDQLEVELSGTAGPDGG